MPEDKDSSRSGAGDDEVQEQGDEEDLDGDSFDAGEGATIDDRVSRAASKSGQSESDTEDDPVGPMTPGPTDSRTGETTTPQRKVHAVSFSRTTSVDDEDPDDEESVDPTPIPATPLDGTPPLFPSTIASRVGAGSPPMMVKTKSSSSTKSRKRKEARAPVPFPLSQAAGADDRPRRVPAGEHSARSRWWADAERRREGYDCAENQKRDQKPEPDPGLADPNDPDADDLPPTISLALTMCRWFSFFFQVHFPIE